MDPTASTKSVAIVGITDYAQNAIGDIVFVSLPKILQPIKQGEEIGSVESVKGANSIYSPVSGIIKEVNVALNSSPELINTSPYELGWICKIEMTNEEEAKSLFDEAGYKRHCESSTAH